MPEAETPPMRLTYPSYVAPGTVVMHDQSKSDVTEKFIAVDTTQEAHVYDHNAYTVDLRRAGAMEVYELAKGGHEPRSIVEFYIIRRKWTPYGYAKVWGSTPTCPRPVPPQKRNPLNIRSAKEMLREIRAKQLSCTDWYSNRRGIRKQPPKDLSYVRMVNDMYRTMQLGGGSEVLPELPKTQATLDALRDG